MSKKLAILRPKKAGNISEADNDARQKDAMIGAIFANGWQNIGEQLLASYGGCRIKGAFGEDGDLKWGETKYTFIHPVTLEKFGNLSPSQFEEKIAEVFGITLPTKDDQADAMELD